MHRVLEGIINSRRIAGAYLFVGPRLSNKVEAAAEFAAGLSDRPIDRLNLEPDGIQLKIEQVRELQQMIRFGPAESEYLTVVVAGADELTAEAAGAFLKTLEEPPPRVVFILLVEREERIPATIVSRCQKIIFGEAGKAWAPDPELLEFYQALATVPRQSVLELLALSSRLAAEKERRETLLYELAFFARHKMQNIRLTRILLEAVKNLKKRANVKLLFDVACLKMGEACQNI